jgi:glycosyltransferase involved in cell wall biosynthesis
MAPAKITILTPVKNGARYFRQCLDSIDMALAAGASLDHIVVDAASTDGTLEMLEGRSATQVFVEPALDAIAAMKFGLARASGDYIFLLMSDDYLTPDFTALADAALTGGPDLAMFACRLFGEGWARDVASPRRVSTILSKYHGMNSVLIRRGLFQSIEMPLRYRLSNDRMMMLMLWEKAGAIAVSDNVIAAMRVHEGSQGNKIGGNDWEVVGELARIGHELMDWNPQEPAAALFAANAWRRVLEARTSVFRLGAGPLVPLPPLVSLGRIGAGRALMKRGGDALVETAPGRYEKPFAFAASGPPSARAAVIAEALAKAGARK